MTAKTLPIGTRVKVVAGPPHLIEAVEADRNALEALAGSVLTDHIITLLKERA